MPKNRVLRTDPKLEFGLSFEDVSWKSADGTKIRGWYIPPSNSTFHGVVVLCHGIDGNRTAHLSTANWLSRSGYATLLFDFRGRGESDRTNCTMGLRETEDLLGGIDFVSGKQELREQRICVLGHSMGGAVAILAAARDKRISGVISESPFSQLDRAIDNHFRKIFGPVSPILSFPVRLIGERWIGASSRDISPITVIGQVGPRPILLIEDELDQICPPSETTSLIKMAHEPKEIWKVPGAGHIEAKVIEPEEYQRRILGFLEHNISRAKAH